MAALHNESHAVKHGRQRYPPISTLMFHVIVKSRPQNRECRHENEKPPARAKAREDRPNKCFIIRYMLEYIQRVNIIQ